MKRANGTGTIYKRTDYKRRRKPWIVVINVGTDPITLKRKKRILGSFESAKEAQAALDTYNCMPKKFEASQTTVAEIWQAVVDRKNSGDKHLGIGYETYWKNHASTIGKMPISEVRTMHMQQVIDSSGVNPTSQRTILSIFRWIFEYALANDLVNKDYSAFIKPDPLRKSDMHRPYSTDELRALWRNSGSELVKILLIQIYTGMRKVELCTMKLEDVHLKERYMIGGSKTEAGRNRIIPIAECIAPFVQHFYTISKFAHSPYLIMPDKKRHIGSWNGIVNLRDIVIRVMKDLKLSEHRTHDARHTFITMASNYHLDETTVKRIVGHSRGNNVTQDVYTHKMTLQLQAAVNSLPHGPLMYLSPEEKDTESGSHVVAT